MLSKYNWMSLATGVLLIIAAVYMFANPAVPLAALGFIFSFAVLLGGVFELVRYFGALKPARTGWDLVNGLLTVLVGIMLLSASAGAQATLIPTFVGLWLIVWALIRIMSAQKLKYLSYGAGRHLLFGAVAVWGIALVLLLIGFVFVGDFFVSRRTKRTVHISPDGVIDVEAH